MTSYTPDTVRALLAGVGFAALPESDLLEVVARFNALTQAMQSLDRLQVHAVEPWPTPVTFYDHDG